MLYFLSLKNAILNIVDIVTTASKNRILIRLTEERWEHILLMHPSLEDKQKQVLATVRNPDYVMKGKQKELLAVSPLSGKGYLVVIYKEEIDDGFIITAFETTDMLWLFKKEIIWSKPS